MSARSSIPDAATDPVGPSGPVRTCIGCRTRERSTVLLRVVAVDGVVTPDLRRRLPGRGAWLHPDPGCLDAAERRRAFGRALRVSEPLDTTGVRVFLETQGCTGSTDRTAIGNRSPSRLTDRKQVDPT
jgi:predicted RNA-binding protein YlxR (DUF448 family)